MEADQVTPGGELLRLAAFTEDPNGGNPAGVWIGDILPTDAEMQAMARDVGYSETAFNARVDDNTWLTRYYSPEREVPFCGHATIATGVHLGRVHGDGIYMLETAAGPVQVEVTTSDENQAMATLTSVAPSHRVVPPQLLSGALARLGWTQEDLDPGIPPGLVSAGAWHLILGLASRSTLACMDYDFAGLKTLMLDHDLTTVQLVHMEHPTRFHSRNPFPVGGVVEDPATGAAAAALGAHIRQTGLISPPVDITIHQGHDMGRPSLIRVHIPLEDGIRVSGTAVPIDF